MRKNHLFLTLAIVATLTMVGCQREEISVNPLYNPETKEVTANFILNVAAAEQNGSTKMTADIVQKNQNFRGIEDFHIFAYSTGTASGKTPYVLETTEWNDKTVKEFPLGVVYRSNQITNTDIPSEDSEEKKTTNETESSRRVLQLSIPVGTDAVLIYGKAIGAAGSNPSITDSKTFGRSVAVYDVNPANTEFKVWRRIGTDADVDDYNATGRLMIFVINRILGSEVESDGSQDGYSSLPALSWKTLGAEYEYVNDLYNNRFSMSGDKPVLIALEEILGKAYSTFTYIKNNEYRAGASKAIKYLMQNMYSVVHPVATATPTEAHEANAKRLALEIQRRMTHYFNTSTWEYLSIDSEGSNKGIKEIVVTDLGLMSEAVWDDNFAGARDLNDYPYEDFNIPEGAAQLSYSAEYGTFSYMNPNKPLVNPEMASFLPTKYVYAPELFYYVNSPIRVNETMWDPSSPETDIYPNGSITWSKDSNWGTTWVKDGKVSSSTRSVAVRDNINYGVALLKTSIAVATDELKDNRYEMTDHKESNQTISSGSIVLTGILVGGVNPRYNWQFLRKYTAAPSEGMDYSKFDGVIYDDQIVSSAIPTPTGSETYTLVYDNYDSDAAADAQRNVYVAFEFENQGIDFWGRDNLIPNGSKFYMVAKLLNTEARQAAIQWPQDHQVPPVYGVDGEAVPEGKKAGESKQIPRIFIQDFMTTAVVTLNELSLQKAYYTMPDLRTSNMSLGLSVDLQWEAGYKFEDLVF